MSACFSQNVCAGTLLNSMGQGYHGYYPGDGFVMDLPYNKSGGQTRLKENGNACNLVILMRFVDDARSQSRTHHLHSAGNFQIIGCPHLSERHHRRRSTSHRAAESRVLNLAKRRPSGDAPTTTKLVKNMGGHLR